MRINYSLNFDHLGLNAVQQRIANFTTGCDHWDMDDAQMYIALCESRDRLRAHPTPAHAA
jgi:hypothetical protein